MVKARQPQNILVMMANTDWFITNTILKIVENESIKIDFLPKQKQPKA